MFVLQARQLRQPFCIGMTTRLGENLSRRVRPGPEAGALPPSRRRGTPTPQDKPGPWIRYLRRRHPCIRCPRTHRLDRTSHSQSDPSTTTILDFAALRRRSSRATYSAQPTNALAASRLSNSMITRRFGTQSPSTASTLLVRTRNHPPCASMTGRALWMYSEFASGSMASVSMTT